MRFGVVIALASLAATADVSAAERTLSFAEALALAEGHPVIVATAEGAKRLRAAEATAPLLDANPTATLSLGPRLAPSDERGFEGGLSVTQSVSLAGAARLRKEAVAAEARWLTSEVDARRLERRVAIAKAWLDLREAERRAVLQREEIETDARTVAVVARLASVGERTRADVAAAELQLAETRTRSIAREAAVAEARAALSAELGPQPEGELVTRGPAPAVELPDEAEQRALLEGAAALPAVRAKELFARSEWIRAEEERSSASNRLGVGLELRRDALGATVLQTNLQLPVPLFELGWRERVARQAAAERLDGETVDEAARARTAVALAIHEVQHTAELRTALEGQLLPAAERALALRHKQLLAGEGTTLEVLDARRAVATTRGELVAAEHEESRARVRLALLHETFRGRR